MNESNFQEFILILKSFQAKNVMRGEEKKFQSGLASVRVQERPFSSLVSRQTALEI